MQRRTLVVVLALLVVGAASVVWALRPATRFILGVVAGGPGEALLLTRRNDTHSTRFWIEHVDRTGPLRWSAELTPIEPGEALGFSSVAVADGKVIVLGGGPDGDVVLALDQDSGARLWTIALPAAGRSSARIGSMVVIDGPRAVIVRDVAADEGAGIRIDALALADGAHLWTHEPGDDGDVHRVAPDRLLLTTRRGEAALLDGASGRVLERLPLTFVLCPLPDGVLGRRSGRLIVVSSAPARELPGDLRWRASDGPCGARDGDLVVGVRVGERDDAALVRLAPDSGQARWQTDLGDRLVKPVITVDGRLPRYLPVAMDGGDAGTTIREFALVDLDTGAIVRRGPIDEHMTVVVTHERGFLWLPFRGVLVGFDPTTGAYTGATGFRDTWTSDLRHEDVRFGELWLHGMAWGRPAALPWVNVDLASGQVARAGDEVGISDASAQYRGVFGE